MAERRPGAKKRPRFSQHFLRSPALAASLAAQAPISRSDLVVEIGAGQGILTAPLAERCRKVLAVELDRRLCAHLRNRFGEASGVEVINADFLRFDLPEAPYKVVGNIPFDRTSEIVRRLTTGKRQPTDTFLVLQREAAMRFGGSPYASETLPSLLLKPWWHAEIVRQLPRADFDPAPRVDAAVLWLARRARPLVHARRARDYRRFVSGCFERSGGTTSQCLKSTFSKKEVRRLGLDLGFDPGGRPSTLRFEQWLGLFRFLELRRLKPEVPLA